MNFLKAIAMNWKTSLAGGVLLLFALVPAIPQAIGMTPMPISAALPAALGLIFAKDGNKTGLPQ